MAADYVLEANPGSNILSYTYFLADTVYECELKGDASSVEETLTYYKEEAKKADSSATVSVTDVSVGDIVVKNVKIQFSCAAEKIIFQMRTKAV